MALTWFRKFRRNGRTTIRKRIWLSAALALGALTLIEINSHQIITSVTEVPGRMQSQVYDVALAARDLKSAVRAMDAEFSDLARTPTTLAFRRFERRMSIIGETVVRAGGVLETRLKGTSELLPRITGGFRILADLRKRVSDAVVAGDKIEAFTLVKTDVAGEVVLLRDHLTALIARSDREALALQVDVARMQREADLTQLATLFVALSVLFFAARQVIRSVVDPTVQIAATMRRVAAGDLRAKVPHHNRDDEIGEMARATEVFLQQSIATRDQESDTLTRLPVRDLLVRQIEVYRADPATAATPVSLVHIDIDGFADINDGFGREIGDALLLRVAAILSDHAERGDILAREGADSFLWFRPADAGGRLADAARTAEDRIATGHLLGTYEVKATCRIGLVLADAESSAGDILINAESALLESRRQRQSNITVYTSKMGDRRRRRRETLMGLKFALDHGEIVPFFQPQVDAKSGALVGFEALVRWSHPEHGLLAPWQFLEVAESTGLISRITDTMADGAMAQLSAWRRAGFTVPRVSLNISAEDLSRHDFTDRLMLAVDRHGLCAQDVCIELLETSMIEESSAPVRSVLERLSELGFIIELDDFGTGHAAIASLQLISLNGVKIDRSFVTGVHERPNQMKLITAMLRLAKALQIPAVAEGVETAAERDALLALGCTTLQGYGIGMPMSGTDATDWLAEFTPDIGRMEDARKSA
ncbi:MAG: EAL domain-containing protein [Pseudomonadota bacterium]